MYSHFFKINYCILLLKYSVQKQAVIKTISKDLSEKE